MSTWNTEPPEDIRVVLIRDENNNYLVAYYYDDKWEPAGVRVNCNDPIEHDLDEETIVWQELK